MDSGFFTLRWRRCFLRWPAPLLCSLQPGGSVVQPVARNYNAFAYIVDGEGKFGADGKRAVDGQMVILATDGDEVLIEEPAYEPLISAAQGELRREDIPLRFQEWSHEPVAGTAAIPRSVVEDPNAPPRTI